MSADSPGGTASRKHQHIDINLRQDVSSSASNGLERYRFEHVALPELDLDEVDTSAELFGRHLAAPVLVSSMTGGVPRAQEINEVLAAMAQEHRFALALGSGRVLVEAIQQGRPRPPGFDVRRLARDVPVLANLGAVQLRLGMGVRECRLLVEAAEADALILHLNPLQEALQPEGTPAYAGLLRLIENLCRELEVPIVVKEVGWGIGADLVKALLASGVAGVDVAGAGGTSWSEVEKHRLPPEKAVVAGHFRDWGIPTAEALVAGRHAAPDALLIASGGIRDGVEVAKCVALGADLVGLAAPFLRAAAAGGDQANALARELTETLRLAMFATASRNLADLRSGGRLVRTQTPAAG